MKNGKFIVGILLIVVAVVIVIVIAGQGGLGSVTTVKIYYGSEKKGLLHDEKVIDILRKKYKLEVDGTKLGSIEMMRTSSAGIDALWPSSEVAARIYLDSHSAAKRENIFQTPIVLYSWPEVTEVLIKAGLVQQRDGGYFLTEMEQLLELIMGRNSWDSLGVNGLTSQVVIRSTNPAESNSGFLLYGLYSILLNGNTMVTQDNMGSVLSRLEGIHKKMGYQENSTGILFENYINQGVGAYPLIAGYESQIIEFYIQNPKYRNQLRDMIRVLVPEPTIWSNHTFIALTGGGEELMLALQDEKIQEIAWESYGFRTGLAGVSLDTKILATLGLPEKILSTITPPSSDILERLIAALE